MFTTAIRPLDLYVGGAWDFPSEGATSATLNAQQGQAYDLAQNDDVSQYVLMFARRRNPTLQRLELAQGDVVINGGLHTAFRHQFLANDEGLNGVGSALGQNLGTDSDTLKQGYERRNFKAWIPDLWVQILYKKFRFEAEAAMVSEGRGDDFAEVRIALSLLRILGERPARTAPPVKRNGRRLVGEEC